MKATRFGDGCLVSLVSSMQAASTPAAAPAPPAPPDPRLQRGPLYIMAPGSGLLTGGAQLVHQQQVQRRLCASCLSSLHQIRLAGQALIW